MMKSINLDNVILFHKKVIQQTGIAIMLLLLKLNNIEVKYTQQELIDLGLGTATGEFRQINILHWIKDYKQSNK